MTAADPDLQIHAANERGRDYVVGDIHGCFYMLDALLARIGFDATRDRLFSVGDLVDRGPDSERAGEYLDRPWFHAIRGNHEDMLLDAVAEGGEAASLWRMNGGGWFDALDAASRAALTRRVAALPHAIEVALPSGGCAVLVHGDLPGRDWPALRAGLAAGTLREDDRVAMVWDRESARRIETGRGGVEVTGAAVVFLGHTPMPAPIASANTRWIDTGAFMGRRLTLAELAADGRVWSLAADLEDCEHDWRHVGTPG
ncbi:serine/threonine protein phosphatase [Salinisphaera orenii MK-B5]|uniref:Serine/threonine protein phosphatase n=1 Tax=Salinisphaera orenii MK-B5 TaxID=856730 RepID=A0A423PIJ9_9GAMM|nr:metallophosphoesterase [Salinisphaera orenii]ROO25375.1 serine/threonine protein phosphatase [Salinisphaera orenii MK-B5]